MKTDLEIAQLKRDWLNDPCWDIEETEGFEEFRQDLLMFRLQHEKECEKCHERRLARAAEELSIPDNLKLTAYVLKLESRIAQLEERLLLIESCS